MRTLGRFFIVISVLATFVVSLYFFAQSPMFRLQNVDVELANDASTGFAFPKIKESLDIHLRKYAGRQVWNVDLEDIFDVAKNDLRVQRVSVRRRLPNRIELEVLPHTPVANILGQSSDKVFPLARDGEILPAVPTLEAGDAPLLRGHRFLTDKDLRAQALQVLLSLPEKGALSLQHVSEVDFHKRRGFQLTISPDGTEVWLGFEDFTRRSSKAERVLAYLQNKKMHGRVIDARYGKKVVVKLRNEP